MLAIAAEIMATEGAKAVAVCQDAHMDEVYLGLYAAGSGGVPELLGAERLLFATDLSMTASVGRIRSAEISEAERRQILSGNMRRILDRRGTQ